MIYLSSAVGRLVMPFGGLYAASKFALEALAEAASYELEPLGVRSFIVQPGAYGTDFGANLSLGADEARVQSYGPVKEIFEGFMANFGAREQGDAQEVVSVIMDAVEGNVQGLRKPVGEDMKQPVEAMNETAKTVQEQLLSAFGMAKA